MIDMSEIVVELVSYTNDPIKAIESAASNCYNSTPTKGKIMRSCYKSGHHSVLEFAQFQFKISGISRACSHQLVRHRTGSFAQQSQRYVKKDSFKYIVPSSVTAHEKYLNVYEALMQECQNAYNNLVGLGVPVEDARYVLPNACETVIDVSFDLRNLIHFCNERLCTRTQWELRQVAQKMADCVAEVESAFKEFLKPKCEIHTDYPFCTENKSCGRHPKLSDVYKIQA